MSPGGGGGGSYFRLAVPGRRKQPGNLSMNLVKPAGRNLEANFDPSSTPTRASRPSRCVRIRARRGAPRIHGLGRRARDATAFVGGYVLSPKPLLRHFHIAAMVGGGKPLGDSVFAGHAAAGAAAISASAVAVHPLDTVKTLIQLSATGPKQKMGLRQVVDRLMSASGPAGLYSGIGRSMLGKLPSLGARFGTYELLTAFYKDGREDNHVYYSETMLAGIAAGAVEAFLCTPFELLKLRTQVGSAIPLKAIKPANVIQGSYPLLSKLLPGYVSDVRVWNSTVGLLSNLSPKHPDMMGALKQHPWMLTGSGKPPLPSDVQVPSRVVALEGWGALWRGLRPGIARDCVFSGMFFSTWQFIDTAMLTWKAVNMKPEPRNLEEAGPVSPFASSLAAGFSGVVAAAASHTFDTAKSRSQCTVIPKYIAMERRFLKWKVPGMWIEQMTGISPTDRNVLFRGIGLRMACSGIASFVLVGSYYFAIDCIL